MSSGMLSRREKEKNIIVTHLMERFLITEPRSGSQNFSLSTRMLITGQVTAVLPPLCKRNGVPETRNREYTRWKAGDENGAKGTGWRSDREQEEKSQCLCVA